MYELSSGDHHNATDSPSTRRFTSKNSKITLRSTWKTRCTRTSSRKHGYFPLTIRLRSLSGSSSSKSITQNRISPWVSTKTAEYQLALPLTPFRFIDFIFRNFYNTAFRRYADKLPTFYRRVRRLHRDIRTAESYTSKSQHERASPNPSSKTPRSPGSKRSATPSYTARKSPRRAWRGTRERLTRRSCSKDRCGRRSAG